MRLSRFFLFGLFLLVGSSTIAQENDVRAHCVIGKSRTAARTTIADPGEDNYDVKYVKLNLAVTNTSTNIKGDVTTLAKVTATTLSTYVFELIPANTIDSVLINGVLRPFTSAGVVRTVTLSSPLPRDTFFTAQVFYRGTPPSGTLFGGPNGINNIASPSWGNRATYTLSEAYHAREWWPCKQSLRDKIDSADIWLTVPDSLKAGSNGLLMNITAVDSTHDRYEWKERYPIDYYLISLAVANYVDYSFYMTFTGSPDSMLVQNYVYSNPDCLPYFITTIDSTTMMMNYFSKIFGRYPFWREKYGHCMTPLGGGMEHQTMTSLGNFNGTLMAHELGHQWFGDNVTCGSWGDIFVNEGFATYSEYLFIDRFRSHASAINDIVERQDNVKSAPGGAIFIEDTASEATVFDSRVTYDKGACVLHMLRFVFSDDSTFFRVLRTYQQQYQDSTATIEDFKSVNVGITGNIVNGMNMDTFYTQWMYKEGFPEYTVTWNQFGSDVYVYLNQITSVPSSCSFFYTPIELRLQSASGDTVIRVFNNQPLQLFRFTWDRTMTNLRFDPNKWLLYEMNSITRDVTLSEHSASMRRVSIKPNPTADTWIISNVENGMNMRLTDVTGRVLWQGAAAAGETTIPGNTLAPGIYMLHVGDQSYKLVKQ